MEVTISGGSDDIRSQAYTYRDYIKTHRNNEHTGVWKEVVGWEYIFSVPLENFHSYGNVTIASEALTVFEQEEIILVPHGA